MRAPLTHEPANPLTRSASSDAAFRTACAVLKPEDTLLVVTIVQDVQRQFYQSLAPHLPPFPSFADAQRAVNLEGRHLVEKYGKLARSLGVQHLVALLGISTHEGEFLCRLAKNRAVDYIVMVRRPAPPRAPLTAPRCRAAAA